MVVLFIEPVLNSVDMCPRRNESGKTDDLDQGWEIQDPFYSDLYNRAKNFLTVRNNTLHTRITYYYARKLLEAEGGNPRLVLPTIILHDTGYSQLPDGELKGTFGPNVKKPELQRLHETEGVRLAEEILQEIGYPANMIQSVQSYIDGHDTRKTTLDNNDMIVKDADKLCRYSYEGFLLNYEWYDLAPQAYLDRLITHVPIWFFTRTAKMIATEEVENRKNNLKLLE